MIEKFTDGKILQFIKYCMVGVLNTLVTFSVIYLCKSFLGLDPYVCNAIGYICGVINSFLCNRQWVFHSHGQMVREAIRFIDGFVLCYGLQLWVVWMLNDSPFGALNFRIAGLVFSGYGIATILGNIVYTLANFIYNRLFTFRQ